MIKVLKMLALFSFLFCCHLVQSQNLSGIDLRMVGDTLNFEVYGVKNWNYDLKRIVDGGQTKVVLKLDKISDAELKSIKNIRNPYVSDITVNPKSVDHKPEVTFFLNGENVEAFDYLTEDPPRLVIDFYSQSIQAAGKNAKQDRTQMLKTDDVSLTANSGRRSDPNSAKKGASANGNDDGLPRPGKLVSELDRGEKMAHSTTSDKINTKNGKVSTPLKNRSSKGQGREIAQERIDVNNIDYNPLNSNTSINLKSGLFDGGDPTFARFKVKDFEIDQQQIIKGLNNYYLPFPMLDQALYFWTDMKNNPPKYEIQHAQTPEFKNFRLIKNLFDKKRALVLEKTLHWYQTKFPHSPYLEVGYLMTADQLMEFGKSSGNVKLVKRATEIYEKYLELFPDSLLNERTSLMMGFVQVEEKDYFKAIRRFQEHAADPRFAGRKSVDYALLGQAYSLSRLGQLTDANATVDKIKNPNNDIRIEAEKEFSKADYLMRESKYSEAVAAYTQALKKFPQFKSNYPNAWFNQMESQFRIKNPVDSHQSALEFVQNFPSHEYAPFALTRLGELLEILVKDPKKSVGAYLETHFRYGDDPKTVIARLHLLSSRMKGMKELELQATLKKMDELTSKSTLENLDQFKVIMVGDGFASRNEFDKAIDILEKFYQQSPSRKNSEQVTQRISRYANEMIRVYSDAEQHREVLKNMQKHKFTWLKNRDRIDTDFAMGRAYQAVGVYDEALAQVQDVKKKISQLGNSPKDLKIKAMQTLPSMERVLLTEAQLLFELNQYKQANDSLELIKNVDVLSVKDQIDRVFLASKIYEQSGNMDAAVRFLRDVVRHWKDEKRYIVDSQMRLATLESNRGFFDKALDVIKEAEIADLPDEDKIKILQTRADIALKAKKNEVAIKSLQSLIDLYGSKSEFSEDRYKLGNLYFEKGDVKNSEKIWTNFPDESVWQKLAADKMTGAEWMNEHKKYIKRLPAAAEAATEAAVNGVKDDNKRND